MSAQLQILQLPRDINRFCRACMTLTDNYINCFDNYIIQDNEQTELCRMFESVTSLNVALKDGLPETICQRCTEQITASYMFKSQCQRVDKQLQSLNTLTDPSFEKTKITNDSTCTKPKLNNSENNYQCNVCQSAFLSYYSLSIHMIEHDRTKNLFERFVDNQDKNRIVLNHTQPSNAEVNIPSLVKARKLSSPKNSISNAINDKDYLKEEHGHDEKIDIKPENNDVIITCSRQLNTSRRSSQKRLSHLIEIRCKICSKEFKTRKELISHLCTPVMNHNGDNTGTICTLCEKSFPNPSTLSLHFLKHAYSSLDMLETSIDTDMIFCEVCGQICNLELDLQLHYEEKHGGKPSGLCFKCCQTFDTESALLEHDCLFVQDAIMDSLEKENNSCVLCNTSFTSKETLLKHSVEHLMKKYTCKKCFLSFCTRNSYFSHLATHTPYRYSCSTCGKALSTKSALKSHIVGVHSNELNHTCSTCGKSFATPSRLKIHSQIHKNHKKYICSYCGYSTHKAGDLQIHIRIHTSERPYKCTFANCNASFKTSSHLCEHVRRHLQIKKFKCNVCGSGFSSSNGLKIHYMQHTGEKPYSCPICNVNFRRKYHVKVHMKQHEPKPYQ
ncbi:hypothetical protein ILUMI_09591 [Ignelater luminosus]|uniref:Uncharacterized protein n=1 Tax=Ignelater luminosus TaxID=2038154 RepID=A0A8K0CZP9_IGNLU|nr:hypothetical protein ILUMI_09591 [Ignelater luminosus]